MSAASVVAELAEIDALPGAKVQPSARDGYGDADAAERALGMGGHIVGTLQHMVIVGFVLLDHPVENLFQVRPHIRVGILIDAQGATGVLDEEMQQPRLWQRGQMSHHFGGDEMESSALGRE